MLRRAPLRRRGQATARSRRYRRYLLSPEWKKRRQAILERDGFVCVFCGEEADQVHHLTYERFQNEREQDLVACCRDCNLAARSIKLTHIERVEDPDA